MKLSPYGSPILQFHPEILTRAPPWPEWGVKGRARMCWRTQAFLKL